MVAAKSSTTIAIRGPSVDSYNNFMIDFFSLLVCWSCLTALYKTYDSRIIDTVKTIIDIYKFINSCGWESASIPCSRETNPPIVKIKTATTNVQ